MKKIFGWLFVLFLAFACNNKKNIPDVSGIKVNLVLERFEKDFFAADSNELTASLRQLQSKYPGFYTDFMEGILGVSGGDTDPVTLQMVRMMLSNYAPLYAEVAPKMANTSKLERELTRAFQFVKYYFPGYKIPGTITFIGTLDAPGVVLTNQYIAIGLQQYAGKDFDGYASGEVRQLYPSYISRRFDPEYIPANCMKAVVRDLFPDNSDSKPLIDQMIEKGKQWWLLDKFIPETADSLKTGYTARQLKWCEDNEGLIWTYITKNEDLRTVNMATLQTYIGEAPFTPVFSQELSPGNIGQWIGWQIVKKFAESNPKLTPAEIMQTPPSKILQEANYKPK